MLKKYSLLIATISIFGYVRSSELDSNHLVNEIKRQSNLTENDVSRWNIFLTGYQKALAVGVTVASGYPLFKAFEVAGAYLGITPLNRDRLFFGGLLGISLGAYKFIYPRLASVLLEKIKNYITICDGLVISNTRLENKESIRKYTDFANNIWANTSSLAIKKGIDNLLVQGKSAQSLLNQLKTAEIITTQEFTELNTKIQKFIDNLEYNKKLFEPEAAIQEKKEQSERAVSWGKAFAGAMLALFIAQKARAQAETVSLYAATTTGFIQSVINIVKSLTQKN